MPNCKIGDRAMIIVNENYGKQCIIEAEYTTDIWIVLALEVMNVYPNNIHMRKPAGYRGIIEKKYVIPLSDPDQNIIETNKELEMT
jgi:hypothetical protein